MSEGQLKGYEKAYRELKTEVIGEDKELSTKQVALHHMIDLKTKGLP